MASRHSIPPRNRAWIAVAILAVGLTVQGCSRSSRSAASVPNPNPPTPTPAPGVTYHVDPVNGSDANDGLTAATALRSLASAVTRLSPAGGDTLVLAGMFEEPLRIEGINNGATPDPARPTVIEAATDANGIPVMAGIDGGLSGAASFPFDKAGRVPGFGPGEGQFLDRGIEIVDCNHVVVSNLHVRGIAGRGVATARVDGLTLDSLTIEWLSQSALFVTNGEPFDPFATDLVIRNCRINQTNLGSWEDAAQQLGYNMKTETVSIQRYDRFVVEGNHLSNSMMEGIDFKLGSRNGVIRNNLVENTRSAGIYANEGEATRIFHNVIRHIGWYDPQDGTGLVESAPYLTAKLPTEAKEEGATGISISNGDLAPFTQYETGRVVDIDVYENVVSWTRKNGISVNNLWRIEGRPGWLVDGIRIYNNVVHRPNVGLGLGGIPLDVGATNSLCANNIVMDGERDAIHLVGPSPAAFFTSSTITHNLLWNNASNGVAGSMVQSFAPEFTTVPTAVGAPASYQLLPSSMAIGAGFPVTLSGTPVAAPDLGAYQTWLPAWTTGIGSAQ